MTTKKVVATGNENGAQRVDPAVVRAEDLVRLIKKQDIRPLVRMAAALGYVNPGGLSLADDYFNRILFIADNITLPEDGEVLPFSEPINNEATP